MPKFSAFNPFGMLKFSNAPSRGEQIYRSMYAAKVGALDLTVGSYAEAKLYAQAMGIARGRYALERAFNQQNPFKCIELLPALEKNWAVIPSETDTILDRQLNVAARMMLVRGATREAIVAGLTAILGLHLIAFRTVQPSEIVTEQPTGVTGPLFARPELPFKLIRLTGPVTTLGSLYTVPYTNADPTAGPILVQKNDIFMVQPDNTGLAEVVTVVSATDSDLSAIFTRSHDIGAFATTQNWVNWTSTQRIYYIIVDNFAALDTETVRRVDDFMGKVSRGVSTWNVVQPTTGGASTAGPFTIDVSPLGAVPLASLPIVPPTNLCIWSFSPNEGPLSGGTLVTIKGRGFLTVVDMTDDGSTPVFTVVDDSTITFTTNSAISGPGRWPVTLLTATDSFSYPFHWVSS